MKKLILTLMICLFSLPVLAKSQTGTVTMEFDLSAHTTGQEVKLWLPYPISSESQKIDQISWHTDSAETAVYTDSKDGNPILYSRWDEDAKSRKLILKFRAERAEQTSSKLIDQGIPLDQATFGRYLSATRLGPIDGPVKALANEITAGKKGILAKARAIYDWTVDNSFRDPETRGCGLGNVPQLLERPGGKCADISSLYVAIARSAGVPAREILGLRLGKEDGTDITGWQHCWAEFYLPGTGWVAIDPADVRKAMLKQNLNLNDPKVAKLRAYYFGNVDPYRIRLSEGRDLTLNPPQVGVEINYLMYPFAQVGGQTIDWLDPTTFKYKITFNQE
nr:transglutaminase family protein [Geopsychrobacter electrodiphilus]